MVVDQGRLIIRRMRDEPQDYEQMVRWCNRPHVREWWDPDESDLSLEEAVRQYGPRTRDGSATTACIIEWAGAPVGYIQFYPWAAYEEDVRAMGLPATTGSWGLDVFLGEPELIDRGIGSAAVDLLCGYLFAARDASSVMLAVAIENGRAIRAYEKAGFLRAGMVLDVDIKGGERIPSWLVVRKQDGLASEGQGQH